MIPGFIVACLMMMMCQKSFFDWADFFLVSCFFSGLMLFYRVVMKIPVHIPFNFVTAHRAEICTKIVSKGMGYVRLACVWGTPAVIHWL